MNATDMTLFCLTYLVIFGVLMGIVSGGQMPSPEAHYTIGGSSGGDQIRRVGAVAVRTEWIEPATSVSIFSLSELIAMFTISAVAAISVGALGSALAGTTVLGIGSAEAGKYVWKAALFVLVATWAGYVAWKFYDMMPAGTPEVISTLFILPPVGGFLLGLFQIYVRGAGN